MLCFTTRREYFDECDYWLRSFNGNPNELIYKSRRKDGSFDAKQVSPETNSTQVISGTFMFDSNSVTLETRDDNVKKLKSNDVVRFRNEFYMVIDVQKVINRKNNQFCDDVEKIYYISLKG